MMTRTTLKALWVGGGGLLATWLAVAPTNTVPTSEGTAAKRSTSEGASTADDLNALSMRLRNRTAAVTLQPSTRNPFRYNAAGSAIRSSTAREPLVPPTAEQPAMPVTIVAPTLTLSGVAQTAGKRTAILSSAGQIYVVTDGDSVAGLFTVVTVEPEAVLLRDSAGGELRLALPQ